MAVFEKQAACWIDYYVNGRRKRERIDPDKKLAEVVLKKRKVVIAEGKYLDRQRPIATTFDELAEAYFTYVTQHLRKRSWRRDQASIAILVDLKTGMIRSHPEDTKTYEGRLIPLTKAVLERLASLPRALDAEGHRVPYVFTYHGKPIRSIQQAFVVACRSAGIAGAVFHDLRHTFVTNMRRAGVDYFRILAITGHKTMVVFKRYHTIDHGDLRRAIAQMDSYMDTTAPQARDALG